MNSSSVESTTGGSAGYDASVTARSLLRTVGVAPFIGAQGVTEIAVNRPGEIWTESQAGWQRHDAPAASFERLSKLANALTVYNRAKPPLTETDPIKPVLMPGGERGQIVIAPACEARTVSMTIRIPSVQRFSVRELVDTGNLSEYRETATSGPSAGVLEQLRGIGRSLHACEAQVIAPRPSAPAPVTLEPWQLEMLDALAAHDTLRFLALAVAHRLNVVMVGGTGSGKTTLMKALADLVPPDVRVATIEDTHELPLPQQPNHVHMFYSEALPARELVKATLRMKFDRVYLAELRGDETWDYLTLLNTGHQGGMTSVHANDSLSAFARIATLIKQSPVGQTLDWNYLLREVKMTIDVVLFMERYRLTQIYYDPVAKWMLQRGLA